MKRLLSLTLLAAMLLSICACGSDTETNDATTGAADPTEGSTAASAATGAADDATSEALEQLPTGVFYAAAVEKTASIQYLGLALFGLLFILQLLIWTNLTRMVME